VITGLGAVTPLGNSVEELWEGLLAGRSGVARLTVFEVKDYSSQIAAEVKGFDPEKYLSPKESRRMDRFVQFAVSASQVAVNDSGLNFDSENLDRIGVCIGSGIGGISTLETQKEVLTGKGPRRISPFLIPMLIIDMAAGLVSIRFGIKGPNSACVTGHLLGAAGGVELIASILALYHGIILPTINLENPGDECDLDYCANESRKQDIQVAMSNSFDFGGHNAVLT